MKYQLLRFTYYKTLIAEISAFLISPNYEPNKLKTSKQKVIDMVGLFILKVGCLVLLALVMGLVSMMHDPENLTSSTMRERFSPLMLLVVGGLILPTLEEVAFRLSLKFKPIYLSLTLSVLTYYLLTKLVYNTSMSLVDESFFVRAQLALFIGLASFPILRLKPIRSSLSTFWERNFRWIYYATCFLFAGVHIFNYELSLANLLLLPLITSPQLLSGIIYGYARVAFGFQYPLIFHFCNNLIAMGISMLPFADLWV